MTFQIEVVTLKPQPILVIEETVAPEALDDALGRILPSVHGSAMDMGAVVTRMPFMRYLEMTDKFRIEAQFGGWDVYKNDPNEVSSPSEIRTRIYQPLP